MTSNPAAKYLDGEVTLAIVNDGKATLFRGRGIGDLASIAGGEALKGACVADRIVGRAAAMLFALSSVEQLHASVLSEGAAHALDRFGVRYTYDALTAQIVNRKGDGQCPMELAVEGIDDPAEALTAVRAKLKSLAQHSARN